MTTKTHKTIEEIANSDETQFGNILKKVECINSLNELLMPLLDPEMARHCQVANYRQGQLIIEVENAAIATILRFQLPDILAKLRQNPRLAGIASIAFYIKSTTPPQTQPQLSAERNLSRSNAELLIDIANGIKNKQLKQCLLKLSKHAQK